LKAPLNSNLPANHMKLLGPTISYCRTSVDFNITSSDESSACQATV